MASSEINVEKLVSDNEELKTRIEQLENAVLELKKGGSDKPKAESAKSKKAKKVAQEKKTLGEIIASWDNGKCSGLCPRFISSKENKPGQDYCGIPNTGFHDKDDKWVPYELDKRDKGEEFLYGIEEFCRSRCDKCIGKGLGATAKHTKNIIQAVKGTPEKAKNEKRNVGASVTGISLPEVASTPSPDAGEKIIVGDYIDQIIDCENLRVVLRRVKNKDGSPRKGRLPRVIGCYYNDGENEYDGTNADDILRKLPGEAIRKLGNCKDETKDLDPLEPLDGSAPAPVEVEVEPEQSKPTIKKKEKEEEEEEEDSDDDGTDDLLTKINI